MTTKENESTFPKTISDTAKQKNKRQINSIKPYIEKLLQKCYEKKIPCFLSFAYKDGDNTRYFNDMISADTLQTDIDDSKLYDFIRILHGYHTFADANYYSEEELIDTDDVDTEE